MLASAAVVGNEPSAPRRILVAMSGGVDSAVAAARLLDAGHHVTGVTLRLWDGPAGATAASGAPRVDHVQDAREVAEIIGIPHQLIDQREIFSRDVVEPFVEAYLSGTTPCPCVYCNRLVKVGTLLRLAGELGADAIATGHYAQVRRDEKGRPELHRGQAGSKDQSYFLYRLAADQLERLVLPLGDSNKQQVRAEAKDRGLPNANKQESQELCFVADDDYVAFVESLAPGPIRPGPILDAEGRKLGEHRGIHRFTVGQRRGLGVALGSPAFVTHIDSDRHAITVGAAAELYAGEILLDDTVFCDDVTFPLAAQVQIRSQHQAAPATIVSQVTASGDCQVVLRFETPVRAISPGQAAVAYHGDRVLGGGRIVRALDGGTARAATPPDPETPDP
jgi:tRNA-specific 2-thiouridylase